MEEGIPFLKLKEIATLLRVSSKYVPAWKTWIACVLLFLACIHPFLKCCDIFSEHKGD